MARKPPFEVRERAAYHPDTATLIVADLHLGKGAVSRVELPLGEFAGIEQRLADRLDGFEPETVVLAGDVLHSFGSVPEGIESDLARLRSLVEDADAELVLLEGNHDTMLDTFGEPAASYRLDGETVVCHGHEEPSEDGECYVIGHDHPMIEIEGQRRPCFLWGNGAFEGADVFALPPFSDLPAGVPVNAASADDLQSPLLERLSRFRPIVYDRDAGEPLTFPPLSSMREFL